MTEHTVGLLRVEPVPETRCPACEGRGHLNSTTPCMGDVYRSTAPCPFCDGTCRVTETLAVNLIEGRKRGYSVLALLECRAQLEQQAGDWSAAEVAL